MHVVPDPAAVRARLVWLALALAVPACRSVEVETAAEQTYAFSEVRTFAWIPDTTTPEPGETLVREPELIDQVRQAVTDRLERAGLENVAERYADVLLVTRAHVDEQLQFNDPYFAFYTVERVEQGTITVDVVDAGSRMVVWSGSSTMKLRDVARGIGVDRLRYRETGEERDWDIPAKVGAMLEECPLVQRD